MNNRFLTSALAIATGVALAGCVATPPRAQYGYNDPYYGSSRSCATCGVIKDVERVYVNDNATTGGGAVLGAIIGGVLGSTVGGGRGRTAATVGGAVAGGFAGNAIERNSNSHGGREAWQFGIQLDDGRWATVTQWDHGNLRPGDRVMIRDNRVMLIR
ncbi:MAG: glycine zipper 2TM domain-containing protein [Xanthomonadales bacterium]|nr:glycine zipper 2TM domain-containing protein [Xanthomonadales bacterium]